MAPATCGWRQVHLIPPTRALDGFYSSSANWFSISHNATLGAKFEWKLRGFGTVVQEFGAFETNRCIRIVPHIKGLRGGHRYTFTKQGSATRIDHELAMLPTGRFRVLGSLMGMMGRRNIRDTTQALQKYLESD